MKKFMLLTALLVFGFAGLEAQSCCKSAAAKTDCAPGKPEYKACAFMAAAAQPAPGDDVQGAQRTVPVRLAASTNFIPTAVSEPQPGALSANPADPFDLWRCGSEKNAANCNPASCKPAACDPSRCDPAKCVPNCLPGGAGRKTKV